MTPNPHHLSALIWPDRHSCRWGYDDEFGIFGLDTFGKIRKNPEIADIKYPKRPKYHVESYLSL